METPTSLVLLIALAVLFGLGIGGVAKALMFSKGMANHGGQEAGGFLGSRRQQKGIASRKIAPNDATKARLEKTFADSASRTED